MNPNPQAHAAEGYAPRTITHNVSAVSGFYAFHHHYGRAPLVNPVPENKDRRAPLAHRSPLETAPYRRARLRPRLPERQPRAIPDRQWDELFAQMGCDRDRAPLARYCRPARAPGNCSVSSARDMDWSRGRLWVVTKGSRPTRARPASPAGVRLAGGLPGPGWASAGGTRSGGPAG